MTALVDYARRGLPLADVPVLDAHAHVGRMPNQAACPLEAQGEEMDRLGIDAAAISGELALTGEFERGNDEVADAIRRYPGRFYGYCHVSGNYPELIGPELERCFAMERFRGIKVYQVGCRFDDPAFEPAWEFAAARSAPVLAHTWAGDLTGLDTAAERHPQVNFMTAHAGSGLAYRSYLAVAERLPNVYLDLTYSREHTNMIEHFVERLGPDRIVWGSDAPCFSMSHQLGKILFARIPDEAKRKIIHHTAARLLGVE